MSFQACNTSSKNILIFDKENLLGIKIGPSVALGMVRVARWL